jgi:hypothetical protein
VIITSIVDVDNARRLLAVGVQVNYDIQWSSAREEVTEKLNEVIATRSFDETLQSITGTAVAATAMPEVVNIDPTSMPTFMPIQTPPPSSQPIIQPPTFTPTYIPTAIASR